LFVTQPLVFQQFNLTQQSEELLPLLCWTWRHGTHQQRLAEHVFKLFDTLRDGGLRDAKLLRRALKASFTNNCIKCL